MRTPDLSLPSVALVAALLLAGCGGQGGGTSEATDPPSPSASRSASPAPTTPESQGSPPVRVRIDAIDVDESVIDLGIADSGELDVPQDPADVGWFTGGGRPGGTGPTVIVGHLDSTTGPAVFARVPQLAPGDTVTVTTQDEGDVEYTVSAVEDFPQQGGFPTERVFGATADDELRLITCTGPYDQQAGRYTENRVVFAQPS
ncbi:class F sortase [Aeromicrobium sp. CF4.19]|uniref:class F sortase n=1 Tax=Aeromicrobium sp. CF4.19 TaxID=3373082 RepID=UPI003EE81B02